MTRRRERGFSLVELMVAMTITLIVSAAIYGLLASGSNAFRREPELSDRQQNIRVAMDLVGRDVFNAGAALPTFSQVFTRTDPAGAAAPACTGGEGLNGCGPMGTLGATAAGGRAPGDGGDPLEGSDVVEMVAADEQCPPQNVCSPSPQPGDAGPYVTRQVSAGCLRLPGLTMLTDDNYFVIQPAQLVSPGSTPCQDGVATQNGNLVLGTLSEAFRVPAERVQAPNPLAGGTPAVFLYPARIVRYRIGPSYDPTESGPALWRSETGRYNSAGAVAPEPGESGFPGSSSPWQLVARGIEDLQVEYLAGDGVWRNRPLVSTRNDYNSIVRQVRITLSARASAPNLAGQTQAGGGAPDAVRGQLSTTITPRAAFNELQMGNQIK